MYYINATGGKKLKRKVVRLKGKKGEKTKQNKNKEFEFQRYLNFKGLCPNQKQTN